MPEDSASRLMQLWISSDCTADPPAPSSLLYISSAIMWYWVVVVTALESAYLG